MRQRDFGPLLEDAVAEVLESMCFLSTLGDAETLECEPGWVTGELDFSGACSGSFGVGAPIETARMIAANFLADDEAEVGEREVAEVVCELTNMACGALLYRVESKRAFTLSPPVGGVAASGAPASENRMRRTFALDEGRLHVWLEIRGDLWD